MAGERWQEQSAFYVDRTSRYFVKGKSPPGGYYVFLVAYGICHRIVKIWFCMHHFLGVFGVYMSLD